MSPEIIGIIGFIFLLVLLAGGMPIGFALGFIGFAGLVILISIEAAIIKVGVISFQLSSHYELGVLPLFLLMAHICFATGASRDFFETAARFWGHRRGGLAMASIGGCAGFGAVSGSSLATAATMGLVAIPEMQKHNYSNKLSAGCVAAGGTVGSLIPPSGMLIVYGILTEQSIGKLFAAGLIPGLTQAIFYLITIVIICHFRPELGPTIKKASWKQRFQSLGKTGDITLLIFFVIGGLLIGWFTPTESGAVGAFGAILLGVIRKKLSFPAFKIAVIDTLKTAGMLYAIIIGAFIFSTFIASSGLAESISSFVLGSEPSQLRIIIGVMIVYFFLGMFLDGMAMMALTIPIFYPIIQTAGINGIWFGILLVRAMEIALITPPVGMNVFVIHGISKNIPLKTIFLGVIPFLIADFFHLALLIAIPVITLFLPSLM
ncbi:MAG: TRAP transporter large permease [Cellvibrionaceae bacterium]